MLVKGNKSLASASFTTPERLAVWALTPKTLPKPSRAKKAYFFSDTLFIFRLQNLKQKTLQKVLRSPKIKQSSTSPLSTNKKNAPESGFSFLFFSIRANQSPSS